MVSAQKHVGVVGSGQMGSGIAQVLAQTGFQVTLVDIKSESLKKAMDHMEKSLVKLHEKGKLSGQTPTEVLKRIQTDNSLESLKTATLVIEAAPEQEDLKIKIFRQLDDMLPYDSILATNTSSLPITRLAAHTKRPDRFVGMHFMNPVPIMQLVEIIRGHKTSEATYAHIQSLAKEMGKITVCSQDYPGFIVNRILMPMINEAFYALMEGVATAEDIDSGMKLGTNQPMGPLALADFIGLDTCLSIMNVLYDGLGDSKYRPCPLLKKYVAAGNMGRKNGEGVYRY